MTNTIGCVPRGTLKRKVMKKKIFAVMLLCSVLAVSSCGNKPAETTTATEKQTSVQNTTVSKEKVTEAPKETTTTTKPDQEDKETEEKDVSIFTGEDEDVPTTMNQDPVPEGSSEAELDSNKSVVYRSYKYAGEPDGTMSYEPYIMVEYNYKKNYVSFYMQFIGVNAYLSPEWDTNLNVLDGEYWIQDFMNADGSAPDLTKVYVKYSPSKITLYYWDAVEERFMTEYPSDFIYEP